jgi:hypothetical protein
MSDKSSKFSGDTRSSLTPYANASGDPSYTRRHKRFSTGIPSAPPNRSKKKGAPHKSPADPQQLLQASLNMVKRRLVYLRDQVDVSKWSATTSKEVTDYIRVLATVAREIDEAGILKMRELRLLSTEELRKRVLENEGGDEASEQEDDGDVEPEAG